MSFVKSKNIKFYPTGYRGNIKIGNDSYSFDPESKLNTEDNSKRPYDTLISYKNVDSEHNIYKNKGDLVITTDYKWVIPNNPLDYTYNKFEFIIDGYYVKIIDSYDAFNNLITSSGATSIYAILRVTNRGLKEPVSTASSKAQNFDVDNVAIIGNAAISLSTMNQEGYSPSPIDNATAGKQISNLDIKEEGATEAVFTGIEFTTSVSSDTTDHVFKILEKVNDQWKVPTSAKLMISLDDIYGGDALDDASKTIKTDTVKSTTVESNTVNADTVKTTNTVTEYITKDTTVDEGNTSYIRLADDYIRINRQDDDLKLNSNINLKTNEIGLEQGTQDGNSHIRILKKDGDNSLIELSADGSGSFDPSYIQMKKGLIHLYQGPGENEIKLSDSDSFKGILINTKNEDGITLSANDGLSSKYTNIKIDRNNIKLQNEDNYISLNKNESAIHFDIQSVKSDTTINVVNSLHTTQNVIRIQQEGTDEQSNNAYQSYINLDAGKYNDDYSPNQKFWIPSIMLSTKIYNSTGAVDKRSVTELTSEKIKTPKVETPLLNVTGDSIKFNSNTVGHVSGIKSNSGNGGFNFYKDESENYAKLNAGALYLNGYNTTYALEVNGATKAKTLYLQGNGTSTDTILDAKAGVVAANSFYATSDRRLKDHIEPIDYNKSILDLPVYTYNYKDSDKKQIGCMAQDLQKLYPELVNEDENGYLSVDNSKVVYLLLEEVKLLKKEIEDLKKSK